MSSELRLQVGVIRIRFSAEVIGLKLVFVAMRGNRGFPGVGILFLVILNQKFSLTLHVCTSNVQAAVSQFAYESC